MARLKTLLATGLVAGLAAGTLSALIAPAAQASEAVELKSMDWPQAGPFGTFDRASLQRGFQVYREVCAACHSLQYIAFRHLEGIGLDEEQIKALAAEFEVTDPMPNEDGDMFQRPGKPSDYLPSPFANKQQAQAANGGAYPPDLSLIVKARVGHENYVYSLLTGFTTPPAGMEIRAGMNYNEVFPGHQIGMPPPLTDGGVEYVDGTKATVDQMAYDVTNFLAWASEPAQEHRKATGVKVVLFLLIFAGLAYAVKRKVWSDVDH